MQETEADPQENIAALFSEPRETLFLASAFEPVAGSSRDLELELSFEKILPVSKIAAKKGKKRSEESQIITSSPYKKNLQDAEKKGKEKKVMNKTRQPVKSKRGKNVLKGKVFKVKGSEYKCLICGGDWLESLPGEDWIQCTKCKFWFHENCCAIGSFADFECKQCIA